MILARIPRHSYTTVYHVHTRNSYNSDPITQMSSTQRQHPARQENSLSDSVSLCCLSLTRATNGEGGYAATS